MLKATGAWQGTFDPRALSQAQNRLLRSAAIVQRIESRAHYLSDTLAGAAIACLVAATTYTVGLLRLGRRRDPQPS